MTITERKMKRLQETVADLRHTVRHNGAAITPKATISEIADHILDINQERVKLLWTDISTIDRVKFLLHKSGWTKRPDLSTEELLGYSINDERLVADQQSWAVVKITKNGTKILTYGGNYYRRYKYSITTEEKVNEETGETETISTTTVTQEGDTELMVKMLEAEDAAWMCQWWKSDVAGTIYSEGGTQFVQIPCYLPGNLDQLISIRIYRSGAEPLEYSLTDLSCDTSNEGMVELPHGIWLIYDNSTLESAPRALMIPRDLAEGTQTGFPFERVEIAYNALLSGLERLRLVGDSFGEEYIVSTQDFTTKLKGTWRE